jgi:diguanylate cyclase (GGDEF)-like protein/PAS domain S-box-containing protein
MNQRLMKETVESKEKYTLMFSTIPDAVLISRLSDGLILEVNQGFVKLSGYSREEAEGKTTADLNIWFDPTERARYVVILTEMKAIEDMEFQFRRKNGRLLLGLLSSKLIDVDGEKHVLNVVRDITSRKKMEDKLRENEQKYRFLTENSGDVIWHINKSYRIDYISSADERIRGYRREEVIGTQIWSVFKPEGIELVRKKIAHHLEMGQIGNNNQITRFEIEQRCKDGSWIWTEIVAAPHYDKYGNLIGYHGLSRDITERKQLLDQLYHEATVDELTQVPNRRHFMNLAEIEFRRAKRYHHPLSLVVIDFDDLKHVNDTYGHLAGDRALSVFSKVVNEIIRDVDVLGRFGGDEFLLLLPETDAEHALLVMERIRNILTSSPVFFGEKSFTISFSAGIASLKEWTDTIEELLNRADSALYQTKDKGGDGASTNW